MFFCFFCSALLNQEEFESLTTFFFTSTTSITVHITLSFGFLQGFFCDFIIFLQSAFFSRVYVGKVTGIQKPQGCAVGCSENGLGGLLYMSGFSDRLVHYDVKLSLNLPCDPHVSSLACCPTDICQGKES